MWRIGDSRQQILAKLVSKVGGVPRHDDYEAILLRKYLVLIKTGSDNENDPRPLDSFINLLTKIVRRKGATPTPGDGEWNLLAKWLRLNHSDQFRQGDSVYDLWRKILLYNSSVPNNLLTGLTAYWKLDEASGVRLDSHTGARHLSQNGTVNAIPGALNNAGDFPGDGTNYLSNSNSVFSTSGGPFSFSSWIKVRTLSEAQIFGKRNEGGLLEGWELRIQCCHAFAIASADAGFNEDRCVSNVPLIANTLYHVVGVFSGSANATIWVNNVSKTDAHLGAANATDPFRMGKSVNSIIDETAVWIGRALTNSDVAILFNGGTPFPYSQFQ